jgi:beta-glucosidase
VSNTSSTPGAETVQIYVAPGKADVARPVHELKGFEKVYLEAGESREITIPLDERAFSYWSERFDDWRIEKGSYGIEVGTSSRDIIGRRDVEIDGDGRRMPLDEWSNLEEWRQDPIGAQIVRRMIEEGENGRLPVIPQDNTAVMVFLDTMPINSLSMLIGPGGDRLTTYLLEQYRQAKA